MRVIALLLLMCPVTEQAFQVDGSKMEALVATLGDGTRHAVFSAHLPRHRDSFGNNKWANISVSCWQRSNTCTVTWTYFQFAEGTISATSMEYEMKVKTWSDTQIAAEEKDDESIVIQFGTLIRVGQNVNTYALKAFINDQFAEQSRQQYEVLAGTWVIR